MCTMWVQYPFTEMRSTGAEVAGTQRIFSNEASVSDMAGHLQRAAMDS